MCCDMLLLLLSLVWSRARAVTTPTRKALFTSLHCLRPHHYRHMAANAMEAMCTVAATCLLLAVLLVVFIIFGGFIHTGVQLRHHGRPVQWASVSCHHVLFVSRSILIVLGKNNPLASSCRCCWVTTGTWGWHWEALEMHVDKIIIVGAWVVMAIVGWVEAEMKIVVGEHAGQSQDWLVGWLHVGGCRSTSQMRSEDPDDIRSLYLPGAQLRVGLSLNWLVLMWRPLHGTRWEGSVSMSMLPISCTPWYSTDKHLLFHGYGIGQLLFHRQLNLLFVHLHMLPYAIRRVWWSLVRLNWNGGHVLVNWTASYNWYIQQCAGMSSPCLALSLYTIDCISCI